MDMAVKIDHFVSNSLSVAAPKDLRTSNMDSDKNASMCSRTIEGGQMWVVWGCPGC